VATGQSPETVTVNRVRAEFQEMPDLRVTAWELQRLCAIDGAETHRILETLISDGFLHSTWDGHYVRGRGVRS
jgi:hypothetical protein